MSTRNASVERRTTETRIQVDVDLDGAGNAAVQTGIPFMDHMLTACARHGLLDLTIRAEGDLDVDAHHTMEDLGIVLGQAVGQALDDKGGINRFGTALVPMDEALARVVIDLSGRPYLAYDVKPDSPAVGSLNVRLFREFFRGLVNNGRFTLHVALLAPGDPHHAMEAVFKAFGRALDEAARIDGRTSGAPSTKGTLA